MSTTKAETPLSGADRGEHTPGPWRMGEQCQNEREKGELHYPIMWPDCGCGAHVFREEDARLIASAPELLAACKAWLDFYKLPCAPADITRAAIAKCEEKVQ
jgi:hypothetical protein